jgi:hypothetical protein
MIGEDLVQSFAHEGAGTEPVVILSATTAATLFPGVSAIERCVRVGSREAPCSRVVGVVADVRRFQIQEPISLQSYLPLGQEPAWMAGNARLYVRSPLRPDRMQQPLRVALHQMDPALRYVNVLILRDALAPQKRAWTLGGTAHAEVGLRDP